MNFNEREERGLWKEQEKARIRAERPRQIKRAFWRFLNGLRVIVFFALWFFINMIGNGAILYDALGFFLALAIVIPDYIYHYVMKVYYGRGSRKFNVPYFVKKGGGR